jgi:outer membrane receptor for ferrienterochelin and colicins
MKRVLSLLLLLNQVALGQYHFSIHVINKDSHQPVVGASLTIDESKIGGVSDSTGLIFIKNLSKGHYEFNITCIGYEHKEIALDLPLAADSLLIAIEPAEQELEDVIVSTSRISNSIKNLPTRVEVLSQEDMEEETNQHPSNVAMLLSEASGIQTQQTSASSGNVQIRILGLDGKYTQLLKDGFPMYSGYSNGLSIMQIPPLDLKQVELIKGSSSSLYGGDAIAGIINFISKKPSFKHEWTFLGNQTNKAGTDMGSFYAARNKHRGITLLNTFSSQSPMDIHNNGFTVLPKLTAFTINPKLFWYPTDSVSISLSLNANYDNRTGGDLIAVKYGATPSHPYIETSKSNRDYYQFEYVKRLPKENLFTMRNSLSLFSRDIGITNYTFSGQQSSTFTEVSYLHPYKHHKTVIGFNFITDQFTENKRTDSLLRNYSFLTTGVFIQDDWTLNNHFTLETGIRNDYQNRFGDFLLPRISLLYKVSSQWSFRIGGGLGYKSATIFDAQTEETAYRNVLPVGDSIKAEKSAGANVDINYSTTIGDDTKIVFDQAFFYTQINNPLVLDSFTNSSTYYYFNNAQNPFSTRGIETSVRLKQDDWSLFAGYTYIDARTGNNLHPFIELTPRNKLVFDLSNEKDNDYKIAFEAFYTGTQYLQDGTKTPDYWITGLMLEKDIKRVSVVLNFEDLTDTRQTRFAPVVIPPITNPQFQEIYAPLEGFMANVAIKVRIL